MFGEYLELNERVAVVAVFESGRDICCPKRFKRKNGRTVEIAEVGLVHPKTYGTKTRHVFDVTDGAADYRLEFDAETLVWRLTAEGDRFI